MVPEGPDLAKARLPVQRLPVRVERRPVGNTHGAGSRGHRRPRPMISTALDRPITAPAIPDTMRALRKMSAAPGFTLEHIPVPSIGPSDVLIRVKTVGLCGTDQHIYGWDHWAQRRVKPPLTIGHEFMGYVAAIGGAVKAVQVGDRVSAEGHLACGICTLCRTGQAHICEHVEIIGVDTEGAFADYIRIPESNVWKLDPSIPDSWAAVFDPLGNAVHTVMAADVSVKSVVITGVGSIGLMAIPVARAAGAAKVFAVDPAAGDHIFPSGEDARSGDLLLEPGRVLSAGDLALLAAAGFARISVFRRPRLALLCTGDELVDIATAPDLGQVRNSNGVMLSAAAEESGAEVVCEQVVADDRASIEDALRVAFSTCDVVLTTGGASRGPRDLVKEACERIGVRFAFTEVAMKPARPTAFGVLGEKAVFVLPGNPAAAFVAWHALARPFVMAVAMRRAVHGRRGTLGAAVRGKTGRCVFVLCDLRTTPESLVAVPLQNQCSSLVRNASRARALVVVPLGTEQLPAGAPVEIEVLTGSDA
jgi:molybdenum cofactor synthesis domain-containing protein